MLQQINSSPFLLHLQKFVLVSHQIILNSCICEQVPTRGRKRFMTNLNWQLVLKLLIQFSEHEKITTAKLNAGWNISIYTPKHMCTYKEM